MTTEVIAEAWPRYELGTIKQVQRLQQGFANENYRITTEKGTFLFRIYHQQSPENVNREHQMLSVLKKTGFPAAFPIPDNQTKTWKTVHGKPVAVFPFINGTIPELNDKTIAETATALALLHRTDPRTIPFKANTLSVENVEKTVDRFPSGHPSLQPVVDDFLRQWETIKPFLQEKLPTGLIHGDLFPDNTIFSNNKLLAIIDFEEYSIDSFLFDIAMTLNGFCFIHNKPRALLIRHFLQTYETLRPLTSTEKKLIVPYLRYTALAMASWHLRYHLLTKPSVAQEKRVRELLKRSREHKYANYL